jgi:hypothetical protein
MRGKARTLPIGTISSGTLRSDDVIPELLAAADSVRMSAADRRRVRELRREWRSVAAALAHDTDDDPDDGTIWNDLLDLLQGYAPDYCSVGAHDGDGADIGVWPSWDYLESESAGQHDSATRLCNASVYKTDSLSDAPKGFPHVWVVNDHGNATLYRRSGRRWVECWSVV